MNINKGDQSTPEYDRLNPNNKMPVIVDPDASGGLIVIFEFGAILRVLRRRPASCCRKTCTASTARCSGFIGRSVDSGRWRAEAHHFLKYAHRKSNTRCIGSGETARLYKVMDKQLANHEYLAGEYSIADIAAWPWVTRHDLAEQNPRRFPECGNVGSMQ